LAIIDFYWRLHPVFWRFFIFFGDNLWFFGDNEILLANWKITTFFSNSAPMWRAKIHKKKPAAASSCHVVILPPVYSGRRHGAAAPSSRAQSGVPQHPLRP
jgi:hypothetical protein